MLSPLYIIIKLKQNSSRKEHKMNKDYKKIAEKLLAIGNELNMFVDMIDAHKKIINDIEEYDIDAEVEMFDKEIDVLSVSAKKQIKDIIISDIKSTIRDWESEMFDLNMQLYKLDVKKEDDEDMPF